MVAFLRFADFIDRRRKFCLVLLILTTVIAAIMAAGMRYDFRPQALFAGDDDLVDFAETVRRTFGDEHAHLLVLVEVIGERDVFGNEALVWQALVCRDLRRLEAAQRLDAVVFLRPRDLVCCEVGPWDRRWSVVYQWTTTPCDGCGRLLTTAVLLKRIS